MSLIKMHFGPGMARHPDRDTERSGAGLSALAEVPPGETFPELLSALNYARRRGVLVVAAAGNDRNSGTSSLSADGGPAGSQVAWPNSSVP